MQPLYHASWGSVACYADKEHCEPEYVVNRLASFFCCTMLLQTAYSAPAFSAPATKPAPKKTAAPLSPRAADEKEHTEAIAAAKALFAKYVALERAFDPSLGNLYAPNATIMATGTGGQKLSFDGAMMKDMIRQSMPVAKMRNDTVEYKNVTYTKNGDFVYIKATRHSNLKNYDAPHQIVVASSDGKNWFIVQEVAQSM